MRSRVSEVLLALFLGAVVPAALCTVIQKRSQQIQQDPTEKASVAQTAAVQASTQEQTEAVQAVVIPVLMDNGAIEQMELNTYLTAVVLCEMPASFEMEALKAQAIVARTYTLKQYESGTKHPGAAVCTDSACCQGYYSEKDYLADGGDQQMLDRVVQAVHVTENQVLVYNGALIDATYFSCSGGKTEDAQAVWGADIPYLQSIESPGEESAAHYIDTVTFAKENFAALLDIDLTGAPAQWIGSITYTDGGGVDTIQICGITYKGTDVRRMLGLRSTAFVITPLGDTVTITTKGFGHRVGMSQYGADAMAVQGSLCAEILAHYYQGTELVNYTG